MAPVLNGTTTVTVNGGVKTFNNVMSAAGIGYTLTASSGCLDRHAVSTFGVSGTPAGTVSEFRDFEYLQHRKRPRHQLLSAAAALTVQGPTRAATTGSIARCSGADQGRRSTFGMAQFANFMTDAPYLGFGSSASVRSPWLLHPTRGSSFCIRAGSAILSTWRQSIRHSPPTTVSSEVDLGTNGTVVGKLFDSDGTTMITQVVATSWSQFRLRGTSHWK